jgi:hypothetical protein
MWRKSCNSILRVIAEERFKNSDMHMLIRTANSPLDQDIFLWPHPAHVVPPMILAVTHAERLTLTIRVDETRRDKVLLRVHCREVAKRERPVERGVLNWAPEIDNLEAPLEELGGVGRRQVPVHACNCGSSGLVNMNPVYRLSLGRSVIELSGTVASKG